MSQPTRPSRRQRLTIVLLMLAAVGGAMALVLSAFQSNLVFFFTPTQVVGGEVPAERAFRLGGMVETGSVQRQGVQVHFKVTDTARSVPVRFEGVLPDLFQEGKGVVAQGRLDPHGVFIAQEVLAKHDENYMPPEAAAALARAQADGAVAPVSTVTEKGAP